MLVLALDSTSNTLSISVYDTVTGGFLYQNNIEAKSSELLGLLVGIFESLALNPRDIGLLLLVSGPGSFTGIRTAATVAKTLAAELGIRIFAINKFELMRFIDGDASKPLALPAGKNDYFVSLDTNYSDLNSNFFTLERPNCDITDSQGINTSSKLVQYWLCRGEQESGYYYDYEGFQPYYLREPSIGKPKA